ncbi:MAG: hypothetical protein RL741_460 [Actinomycetota bacterium]|jgi:sugar O-acyltransferase (sialic acid O-acetyltransferase NeuD family)
MKTVLFGVATPYAWDIVETLLRLKHEFISLDNLGQADSRFPNLCSKIDAEKEFVLAQSSAESRLLAARAAHQMKLQNPITIIDPTAVIASTAELSHGVYVNANATVASNVKIGCFVNINRTASIGHDVEIEGFTAIGPGALIGSYSKIGCGTDIGTGAVILPKIKIGSGAVIGAGSVVVRDVADNQVVIGNPSRFLREREANVSRWECEWH